MLRSPPPSPPKQAARPLTCAFRGRKRVWAAAGRPRGKQSAQRAHRPATPPVPMAARPQSTHRHPLVRVRADAVAQPHAARAAEVSRGVARVGRRPEGAVRRGRVGARAGDVGGGRRAGVTSQGEGQRPEAPQRGRGGAAERRHRRCSGEEEGGRGGGGALGRRPRCGARPSPNARPKKKKKKHGKRKLTHPNSIQKVLKTNIIETALRFRFARAAPRIPIPIAAHDMI